MTGNEVVPIQCDIRDATAVSSAIDSCVEKVNCSKNVINNLQSVKVSEVALKTLPYSISIIL